MYCTQLSVVLTNYLSLVYRRVYLDGRSVEELSSYLTKSYLLHTFARSMEIVYFVVTLT